MTTTVDKNKINKALTLLESQSKTPKTMGNKLRQRLLESEEEELETPEFPEETEEDIIDDENLPAIPDEEIETPEEEEEEYVDITGGVEEKDGVFTISSTPEVVLAPGNKIKFLVGEEEFKGTIGEPIDEEGTVLSIELSDEVPAEEIETPESEEEFSDEDLEDVEEDSIQEGKTWKDQGKFYGEKGSKKDKRTNKQDIEELDENYLSQHNQEYTYGDLTEDDIIEEVALEELDEEPIGDDLVDEELGGTEEEPMGDDLGGTENLDSEEGLDDEGDLGGGISMGGSSSPIGSNPLDSEPGASSEELETPAIETDPFASEDIEKDLITKLLGEEEETSVLDEALAEKLNSEVIEEEEIEEIIKEAISKVAPQYKGVSTKAEKPTTLPTKEITGKVAGAEKKQPVPGVKGFKPNPVAKQTDVQSKKLKTEEPKGTVAQTKATKEKPAEVTTKVGKGGEAHIDPKGSFTSKVKQESVVKSKALVNLAEDLVRVQAENKKLMLENYKLLKVNGLLTLLPELEAKTRVQLVEKFDKCNSTSQITELYTKITSVVKESRKPSLNQIVERKGDIKYFFKERDHDTQLLKERVQSLQEDKKEVLTEAQIRRNTLMGIGDEDGYFKNY